MVYTMESTVPMDISVDGGSPYPPHGYGNVWGYTHPCLVTSSKSAMDFFYPHLATMSNILDDFGIWKKELFYNSIILLNLLPTQFIMV